MQIGLYFGSFNPIHIGHLIIANHILNETDVKKVWFVLSPHNPIKFEASLLNVHHRLQLLRLAIEDENNFKACDIEFKMPKPSYTIDTLNCLHQKYPQHQFSIIMGSDSYQNTPNWKEGKQILDKYKIYVYQRNGFSISMANTNCKVLKSILLDVSASQIRTMIKEKKSLKYVLHERVIEAIERNQYYQI